MDIKMIRANLRLIIIALIAAVSLVIFVSILENVWMEEATILTLDSSILRAVQSHRTAGLILFFIIITQFGSAFIAAAFTIAAALIFYTHKYYRYLIALLVALAGDSIFILFIKDTVKRARPEAASRLVAETGFSFPSGHTFTAICLYGVLTFFVVNKVKNPIVKLIFGLLGIFLILSVSFSRVYLGVHWPSDVIASFIVGTSFVTVILLLLRLDSPNKSTVV